MQIAIHDATRKRPSRAPLSCVWQSLSRLLLAGLVLFSGTACAQGPAADAAYDGYLNGAKQDLSTHRYAAARAKLQTAVTLAPQRAEGWAELGILYGRINDFRNAEAMLRRSLALDARQAEAHYLLGLALIANPGEKLDWPAAIVEFRAALALRPKYAEATNFLGVGQTALGQNAEAVRTLELATGMDPKQAAPHFNLGLVLERTGEAERAGTEYRQALALEPTYVQALSALGKLLLAADQLAEAEQQLRAALRINPDLTDAHYALGRVLRKENKPAEAQAEMDEAQSLGQREPDAIESLRLSNGALARAAKGDLTNADADLRRAVALRADYGVPHYNLGLILADEQHPVEAARQMLVAISLMPGRPQPWVSVAKLQMLVCDLRGAQTSLEMARSLGLSTAGEPASPTACTTPQPPLVSGPVPWAVTPEDEGDTAVGHNRYAAELEAQEDWLDAAGERLHALQLAPADVPARLALAECLTHLGDQPRALLEERKVLLVAPQSAAAHLALGRTLLAAGMTAQARTEIARALELEPASHAAADLLKQLPGR